MQRQVAAVLAGLLIAAPVSALPPIDLELSPRLAPASKALLRGSDARGIPGQAAPTRADETLPDPNLRSGLPAVAPPVYEVHTGQREAVGERVAVPDRWRIVDTLGLVQQNWLDPYNPNTLKGDKPLHDDWFLALTVISDSVFEPRKLPTPVGPQSTSGAGSQDVFGQPRQRIYNQNLIVSLAYLRGNTTFKPQDWEWRLTPVFNLNYVEAEERRLLNIDPRQGDNRSDEHLGLQEAFVDYHLRNVSDRYDFDSLRVGIQPLNLDFRGFLFQDNPLALRLFGTRANNVFQYNLFIARRLEKDTNSGLNEVGKRLREDDLIGANLYWQDYPALGYFSQFVLVHNRNRESGRTFYDQNGFLGRPASFGDEAPRDYDVTYLGYNGDGHVGRLNLTVASYLAAGRESSGAFTRGARKIFAGMGALEASVDYSWIRPRLSLLWASGDPDPFDGEANGFDAIFENPIFAGADTSFWIRQPVSFIGGGGVALSARNGLLNSLRSSKEHGQSNFANPGTILAGLGVDLDITPTTRLSLNANQLWFENASTVEVARNQGNVDRGIGTDISAAAIWRPWMSQNIVLRASAAQLITASGFEQLFDLDDPYSVLFNLILTY